MVVQVRRKQLYLYVPGSNDIYNHYGKCKNINLDFQAQLETPWGWLWLYV
jgi:hypothetical protein